MVAWRISGVAAAAVAFCALKDDVVVLHAYDILFIILLATAIACDRSCLAPHLLMAACLVTRAYASDIGLYW